MALPAFLHWASKCPYWSDRVLHRHPSAFNLTPSSIQTWEIAASPSTPARL